MIKNVRRRHKSVFVALLSLLITSVVSGYYIFKPSASRRAIASLTSRAPASIAPIEPIITEPESTFFSLDEIKKPTPFETTLKLDCQDLFVTNSRNTSASVSSDHVILKLSRCADQFAQIKKIELINKTNGYNAQLFKLNRADFNSDFIQLDKGLNQLEFEISLNDGQKKSQILKIQRIQ